VARKCFSVGAFCDRDDLTGQNSVAGKHTSAKSGFVEALLMCCCKLTVICREKDENTTVRCDATSRNARQRLTELIVYRSQPN